MKRRNFLVGAGGASLGGSLLLGSGAFSRIESDRSVSIAVAEDPNAYLGLDKCPDSPNGSYVDIDDKGHLEVLMNPENPTIGDSPLGKGINSNSTTWFDNVFQICNQGKEQACVWIEDDDDWPYVDVGGDEERQVDFYHEGMRGESIIGKDNSVHVPVGECFCVGIVVKSYDLEEEDTALDELDDQITIVADVGDQCYEPSIDEGELAWVPNKGDATVSKINLTKRETVARYRAEEAQDASQWRTNRLTTDDDGDAWVLNTGFDGEGLQPSVAHISATPVFPDNTSDGHDDILPFGEDDRVTKYEIGGEDDHPRAITWDGEHLWVGFHGGNYVLEIDPTELDEDEVAADEGDPGVVQKIDIGNRKPYNADYDEDGGRIWFSNRDDVGPGSIFALDTADGSIEHELEVDGPYFTAYVNDDNGDVYATDGSDWGSHTDRELHWFDSDEDEWSSNVVSDFDDSDEPGSYTTMRGIGVDHDGMVWITVDDAEELGTGVVLQVDPTQEPSEGDLWEVTNHVVVPDDNLSNPSPAVEADSTGDMWVVTGRDQNPGSIFRFDPAEEDPEPEDVLTLGPMPYVYADFIIEGKEPRYLGN